MTPTTAEKVCAYLCLGHRLWGSYDADGKEDKAWLVLHGERGSDVARVVLYELIQEKYVTWEAASASDEPVEFTLTTEGKAIGKRRSGKAVRKGWAIILGVVLFVGVLTIGGCGLALRLFKAAAGI